MPFSISRMRMKFQSTPSPRRATSQAVFKSLSNIISIHALPAEGDFILHYLMTKLRYISIHALPAEGDFAF